MDRVEDGGDHAVLILGPEGVAREDVELIETDWLIGSDGANSMMRRSLDFGSEGVTFPERFLVMSTSHDFRDDMADLAYVAYVSDADEWLVLLRTPDHGRVSMPVPETESDEDAVRPARTQQRLQSVVRLDSDYEVLQHSLYRVHQRVASNFSQHRVLLAEDSAHMNNPLGRLAINAGLHDAWSAADTILAARAGTDVDKASHVYGTVVAEVCHEYLRAETAENVKDIQERDRAGREARETMIRGLATDEETMRAYLQRTSMLTSTHEAIARVQRELASIKSSGGAMVSRCLSPHPIPRQA